MVAAATGNSTVVEMLLKSKADVNVVNKMDWTALFIAIEKGEFEVC